MLDTKQASETLSAGPQIEAQCVGFWLLQGERRACRLSLFGLVPPFSPQASGQGHGPTSGQAGKLESWALLPRHPTEIKQNPLTGKVLRVLFFSLPRFPLKHRRG